MDARLVEWRGRRHGRAPHCAPVSIHVGEAGRELYRTPEGLYAVEPGRLLVLNAGQTVSTHMPSGEAAAGFAVLFAHAYVRQVHRALATADAALLDDPHTAPGPTPLLAERTHALAAELARPLAALRRERPGDPARHEELAHDLLEAVLRLDAAAARRADRVPAVRASTRAELFRRLQRARDFLHASLERGVTLAELGRVAAIAPHRLLRLFQSTFSRTPQQYLRELRMARARKLLRETDQPVGVVAQAVGFDSFGSFSAAFHRRFGMSPRAYRKSAK